MPVEQGADLAQQEEEEEEGGEEEEYRGFCMSLPLPAASSSDAGCNPGRHGNAAAAGMERASARATGLLPLV